MGKRGGEGRWVENYCMIGKKGETMCSVCGLTPGGGGVIYVLYNVPDQFGNYLPESRMRIQQDLAADNCNS